MTRQQKTPRQRAEEALAVAERKVKKLRADERKHRDAHTTTQAELEQAVVRRDYLAKHPDLPNTAERAVAATRHNRSTTPPKEEGTP